MRKEEDISSGKFNCLNEVGISDVLEVDDLPVGVLPEDNDDYQYSVFIFDFKIHKRYFEDDDFDLFGIIREKTRESVLKIYEKQKMQVMMFRPFPWILIDAYGQQDFACIRIKLFFLDSEPARILIENPVVKDWEEGCD